MLHQLLDFVFDELFHQLLYELFTLNYADFAIY